MNKWDKRFMELSRLIASWSKDPSTQVGAVITDAYRRIVGTGFNGFPRCVSDSKDRYETRLVKYKMIVHAEANAILNSNSSVAGCSLYATMFPCSDCAKLIIQSGIKDIFAPDDINERWSEDVEFSRQMLLEAGVICQVYWHD